MNIREAIEEIQQPRSRYQLIHFVLGQHDTPVDEGTPGHGVQASYGPVGCQEVGD